MNNIYKVIWSKAKNCYVVASEIARSHTKSASGSEKIGGVARRSLLASLMALSLLCGGLGVAEATVHVVESGVTYEVLTTQEVTEELDKKVSREVADLTYAKASDVATNTKDIATNKGNISELNGKLTNLTTVVDGKVDKADTLAGYNIKDAYTKGDVDDKLNKKADAANVYTKTDADANFATSDALTTAKTELDAKIDANTKKITDLQTTTNGQQTAIDGLNTKTTQISYDPAEGTTVNEVEFKAAEVDANGKRLTGVSTLHTTGDATVGGALTAAGVNAGTEAITGGSLSVTGAVTGSSVNAGSGEIKTDGVVNAGTLRTTSDATVGGAVNAGSLNVTDASNLKGDVTMDKKLSVTGDTSLNKTDVDGALTVTGKSDLKGDVTLGTSNGTNTVTVNGTAHFNEAVNMDKGLTVTNGETNLGNTTVTGNLNVTGTITTDRMVFGDPATNNYTEIDKGHITSKNDVLAGDATKKKSSMELDHSKLEVAVTDKDSNGHLTMTADKTSIKNSDLDGKNYSEIVADKDSVRTTVKDENDNTTSTKSSAKEIRNYAGDAAGNKTNNVQTATQNKSWAKDKDGNESSIVQTGKDITNTAQNGTITNNAKDIVNNATGDMTNDVGGKLTTTVAGQATENFKGGLDTTVTGAENHTVTGKQTNTVGGGQENIISGGQTNTITGDQTTTVTGDISNTAKNITNEATTKLTDKVGANTRVLDGEGITDTVGGSTFKQRIDAIMGNVKTADGESEVTQKGNEITSVVGKGEATNSRVTQKKGSLEAAVTDGTNTNDSYDVANASAKVLSGGTKVNKLQDNLDSSEKTITNGTYTTSKVQTALDITNTAKDGTITNDAKDIVNNAKNTITNTAGTSITNQVKDSKVTTDANGTTFENKTAAVSDGGTTTTKINGNHINTGRVDANELGVSDMDGANTADFSVKAGEGVKASAGNGTTTGSLDVKADEVVSSVKDADGKGSTFKQRINAIMMESKDVSIKAEETLTNEAKVITNKASEVINNEAININNTATGTITSKASEIKNEADKLISNKVGENTWENMEDGKITTSIKNGTKQNLIQSDAEKTEHSVVNGSNSTVNKQTSEEITDAVTNGTTTNVTQNTATSSNNTIADKNGNANTVISTVDGTSFINSKAAAPVTGASGAGTAVNTTIKGNTITTGKVTMDYAEVMKDLGVHGSAKVDNNLEVGGTSTLKGDVIMESNATVKGTFNVEGNTNLKNTKVDGTLNVTQKATFDDSVSIAKDLSVGGAVTASSYKVGDKTYISAAGINANDQKITNVADGSISEGSKDAVNGGQLYTVKNDLEGKVNKVGANAAAMANLHPMEFDPDSKWNIAAAIGNYGSETAAALGAFYRPNDDVMVNLSTAFGTGENMVGGGVSVRLGKSGNKLSREESNALKDQVNDLTARMDALLSVLNPNMSKDFPDVPENHWAYEAVSRLAGNDIVQGYPDGEFHGERTMTRYEMAEIIYNALSRGAEAERELVEEFKPELQAMAASEKATAERAQG